MAPLPDHKNMLQRRWSNADGEKVGLWMSFGIIIAIIFFTILLGTLNIYLGKPIAKLREFEDEKAVRDTRIETLTQKADNLHIQLARKTEEFEAAVTAKESAERSYSTQQQLVQQQNERITSLVRERDEKIEELRQRATELAESRLFGTGKADESSNLRNNLRDVETEKHQLESRCENLRLQLAYASEQAATHRRWSVENN